MASLNSAFDLYVDRLGESILNTALQTLESQKVQSDRKQWLHDHPALPFEPHVNLGGLEYSPQMREEALDKSYWGNAAIHGQQTFSGSNWEPNDHPGCLCVELDFSSQESYVTISKSESGGTHSALVGIDEAPGGEGQAGLPQSILDAKKSRLWNDIDDALIEGTPWREAVRDAAARMSI